MAFVKKLWKNRVSDYPTRRLITPVGQGDAFVAEIERNEGTITEEGDPFNAATMNDLEQRIEDGIGAGSAAIAPEETSSTASRAYSVNQFLIYNDKLYKVIATIQQGASLVPDTNIQEDTVGAELTAGITANNSQNNSINGLNGQLAYAGTKFYFDYKNGKWGWNSSAGRGADTFHPFSRIQQLRISDLTTMGTSENANSEVDCDVDVSEITTLSVDSWYTTSYQYGRQPASIFASTDGTNWGALWQIQEPSAATVAIGTFNVAAYNYVKFRAETYGAGIRSGFQNIRGY